MKIATWNVNSIRARLDRTRAWLEAEAPDVLCLQETKVSDDAFPTAEFEELGYRSAVHGQRAYNGVALLARQDPTEVLRGFGDGNGDNQARCIAGRIGEVTVISVYVPNGGSVGTDKYAYKLQWLGRLRAFLERSMSPENPVVLCGDFNVAPDDRDVYDPAVWEGEVLCSAPERGALAQVVSWGFDDTLRRLHSEGGLYSWWDYRMLGFQKNKGLRIDHVYATAPLAARCVKAWIDREARKGKGASDHAPVVAEFAATS